jgi:hypothetical protein
LQSKDFVLTHQSALFPVETSPALPGGGAFGRSARREVRNPVLALPAAQRIAHLPREHRALLGALLRDLAAEANAKGYECWGSGKAMMGAYWRVVAVYSKHLAHVIDPRARRRS